MAIEKQNEFNDQIKTIFRGGKINRIKWGEEAPGGWNLWDDKAKLEFAMELAAAMNQAAEILQNERNEILEKLETAKRAVEGAEQALAIQKAIVHTTLTEDNEIKNQYIQDIQRLSAEVRRLKEQSET